MIFIILIITIFTILVITILIITIRNRKILIVFDNMIADIMTNKKFQATMKELCIRFRKRNISLVFITQSYFSVPKEVRLNSTRYLIMKIYNKRG